MRIIKQGLSAKERDRKPDIHVGCPRCEAIFVIESPKDMYRETGDQREPCDYAVVICPCCKQHIQLDDEKVPLRIRRQIMRSK